MNSITAPDARALERSAFTERRIAYALLLIFFSFLILILSKPFRSSTFWMEFTQDDFFYYLKIAQNVAAGHGSTFNGLVRTNGYHPLYEVLLVLLSKVSRNPKVILLFQAVMTFLAAAVTFALSIHLISRSGLRLLSALALSTWFTLYALRMFYYGMEVTLTIPLALATIALTLKFSFWQRGFWQAFIFGLLISATVLSRLDAIFLVALLAVAIACSPETLQNMRAPVMLGILFGLVPLAGYFVFNHHAFGTWLPISGMAKQLKVGISPSAKVWNDLYWFLPSFFLVMLPIPVAIISLLFLYKKTSRLNFGVYMATLWFPWVYYFVVSCLSDWPIWGGICTLCVQPFASASWSSACAIQSSACLSRNMLLAPCSSYSLLISSAPPGPFSRLTCTQHRLNCKSSRKLILAYMQWGTGPAVSAIL